MWKKGLGRGTLGKGRQKGTGSSLTRLVHLPPWDECGCLVHSVAMVLSPMTGVCHLNVSHQSLRTMRIGLKKPTFSSSPGCRACRVCTLVI